MRLEGRLKSWNDERGFGFIANSQGGKDVFVHISAFPPGGGRPVVNERLSFELEVEGNGRLRAYEVESLSQRKALPAPLPNKGSLLAIPLFAALYLGVEAEWGVPSLFLVLYPAVSLMCFIAYAIDKSAAKRDGWRVSENALHNMSFACGWPGAIVAQILLRHKSRKASFRLGFWLTVLLNVAIFVGLCSPYCPPELRTAVEAISPQWARIALP